MNLGFLWTIFLFTWTLQETPQTYAYVLHYPLISAKQRSYGLMYITQRRCGGRNGGEGVKSGRLEAVAWDTKMRVKDIWQSSSRAVGGALCGSCRCYSGGSNLIAMMVNHWEVRDSCNGRRTGEPRLLDLHLRKGGGFFHHGGSTSSSIRAAGGKLPKGKQLMMMMNTNSHDMGDAPPRRRRVVATGAGVVSGCGDNTVESFWNFILEGKSSINKISHNFDPDDGYRCKIGSEVVDFDPKDYFRVKKAIKTNDRATHFAVAASRMALDDAGLNAEDMGERCGVIVGSAFGGMGTFEKETRKLIDGGAMKVGPFSIPALLGNTAAGVVGIETGAKGLNFGVVSACATATHSIGLAMQAIQNGEVDAMIAGGVEAAITPLSFAGFSSLQAMATSYNENPKRASRPFDKDREGFVMAEGGGVIVLESLEHAEKRGAMIYGELCGYGASGDAYHVTSPEPNGRGLSNALEKCMDDAGGGFNPSCVTYYNAHGTSTKLNDKIETQALKRTFGKERSKKLLISSTKGSTGHALGAAGGFEAIACLKGIVPPTINLESPDVDNGLDLNYVPNNPINVGVDKFDGAISASLGFGGHNAALLFRKFV